MSPRVSDWYPTAYGWRRDYSDGCMGMVDTITDPSTGMVGGAIVTVPGRPALRWRGARDEGYLRAWCDDAHAILTALDQPCAPPPASRWCALFEPARWCFEYREAHGVWCIGGAYTPYGVPRHAVADCVLAKASLPRCRAL